MQYLSTILLLFSSLAVVSFLPAAFADAKEEIEMLNKAQISLRKAVDIAEKHIQGKATSAEIDDDSFTPRFEVRVLKEGKLIDVQVDGMSGKILGSREDVD